MARAVKYPHPGEVLQEEFLGPLGITPYRLARSIDVSQTRIGEIIAGRRSVSAGTALRLAKFLRTSEALWMNLQAAHDAAVARDELKGVLALINPHDQAA